MKLSPEDLKELSNVAIAAALKAGQLIQSYCNTDFKVELSKEGDSMASQIVTEVDGLSQKTILELLNPTCAQYDLGMLAEEDVDDGSRLQKDYFWCVDPIDGTWPFSEGVSGYSVSIALVSQSGEPMIGVVYDPVEENLYTAIAGQGAMRNNANWTPENKNDSLTFHADRSFPNFHQFDEICCELKDLAQRNNLSGLSVKINGGSVLSAMYALEELPAVYFKFPKLSDGGGSLWDFAATACIYQEVTGHVSEITGERLKLNRNDGSTFMNKEGVLYAMDSDLAKGIIRIYEKLSGI